MKIGKQKRTALELQKTGHSPEIGDKEEGKGSRGWCQWGGVSKIGKTHRGGTAGLERGGARKRQNEAVGGGKEGQGGANKTKRGGISIFSLEIG